MHMTLRRVACAAPSVSTLGKLSIDGAFVCYTLEDQDRQLEAKPEGKVPGQTCIPRGRYDVVITWSNRFQRELPLVKNVAGFEGIRIHPGNTHHDTEGCILVGSSTSAAGDAVNNSRATFNALFERIERAYAAGDAITLEIT